MTSGRSELRLLRPDDGRFASWCGSCAKARISLGIRGVGVWATSITQARIDVPAGAQIDPLQITIGARHRHLPDTHYDDYSLVFI
jgi:hypothetical protein